MFQKGNQEARKKGKNKKTIEKDLALEYIRKEVFKELKPLVEAKLDLAKGCWVFRKSATGQERIYQEKPDREAIEDLLNRAIGKVKEEVEHSGSLSLLNILTQIKTNLINDERRTGNLQLLEGQKLEVEQSLLDKIGEGRKDKIQTE